MHDERLWAPWRLAYVSGENSSASQSPQIEPQEWLNGAQHDCFLCRAAATYADPAAANRRNLVVHRVRHSLIVLNRYPYNNGHVMVAPLKHLAELDELTGDAHLECMAQLGQLTQVYRRRMNAEGFNVGLNVGKAAGAGVPGHLHWHLVPRWTGDNNFMPVLAGTRVIPQALEALWELLVVELAKT